ncbi:hypothetical protein D3C83_125920 [compost metagenome]
MLGLDRDQLVHRLQPVLDRLLRQPHHEVERDVVEPGGARQRDGVARACGRVHAAEAPQFLVTK